LQELEELDSKGELVLYYADESHVCTNGYVPYGWQFKNEDVYIPSKKAARLNIFGMITKRNQYKGFTTKDCTSSIFHLILRNSILPRFFGVYLRVNG